MDFKKYNAEAFIREGRIILNSIKDSIDLESARAILYGLATEMQYERQAKDLNRYSDHEKTIMRDCARVFRSLTAERSDNLAEFSVSHALWDISRGVERNDLSEGFFAEIMHLFKGLRGLPEAPDPDKSSMENITGRDAANIRSNELDGIWDNIESIMSKYSNGLSGESIARRNDRRNEILSVIKGTESDWNDWRWQVKHIIKDHEALSSVVKLSNDESETVKKAVESHLPFGITPYYASLMDNTPEDGRDMAIRAQVIPTPSYVERMSSHGKERDSASDFMLEADTSPVDLITRRYPAIVILKPFNTCPQICVYCQRNWEIDQVMAPQAMAEQKAIEKACSWIQNHSAIKEVLITGGDPLAMSDLALESIVKRISEIGHVEMIRIGSRTPVTMPMRITPKLVSMDLGRTISGRSSTGI